MTASIRHRGPDTEGTWGETGVGFGHRRLSIIDLSSAGAQPMHSADGRFAVVFNGEIYNFPELRTRLEGEGIAFRSHSDTEVLVEAFAHWGKACLALFNGIFAFAIWDRRDRALLLARDRLGVKPLYYSLDGSRLVFGSEVKALLAADTRKRVCFQALHEITYFGASLGGQTCFDGIKRLLPGEQLTFRAGSCGASGSGVLTRLFPSGRIRRGCRANPWPHGSRRSQADGGGCADRDIA